MIGVEDVKSWTSQLTKAESNISQATQSLEKAFKAASKISVQSGGEEIPDPIKLVRRLTALENALGRLQVDCEAIATKRMGIVNSIIKAQNSNVVQIQEMLDLTESKDPYSCQEDADVTWDELKLSLKQQLELITSNATAEE